MKAVKRKDTKVSKHYVVTEKHENNNKNRKKIYACPGDRTHGPKCLRLRIKCTNHHAREVVMFTASYDKYILNSH